MELAFQQITMAGRGSRCDLSEKRVIVVLRVFAERWRAEVAESQVEVAFDRDRGLSCLMRLSKDIDLLCIQD